MTEHAVEQASTTEGLPVAMSLAPVLESAEVPIQITIVDRRVVYLSLLSIAVAALAVLTAELLLHLIDLATNLAFYGRFSTLHVSPAGHHLGALVIVLPVLGGLIVGIMARYGSPAIRGHGIPEAMEQVLRNESRIPARLTYLKPLSAAVAIGTGGPFGAEGPIIATGGALGSLVGQIISTTAAERKTLLAAGAAAGMAATFASPVSAVLLAVELLLFEYRPRSIIPVALAAATAATGHVVLHGASPIFAMPDMTPPTAPAIVLYVLLGSFMGLAAALVTRLVYGIEGLFDRLPLHWMWWPATGGLAVGLVGYAAPRTLGIGYENISDMLSSHLAITAMLALSLCKLVSWAVSLASGTSGGTLAPLFTIGGGLGAALGTAAAYLFPQAHVDVRVAALVGTAAMFAGASRAMLASAVFAFETTLQPLGLLPLLGGCAGSFLVSCLVMRHSIMSEKIARRGLRVPVEYVADFLEQVRAGDAMSKPPVTLPAGQDLLTTRRWLESEEVAAQHQGYPLVDEHGHLVGVLTRRDLLAHTTGNPTLRELLRRPAIIIYEDSTLREAADHMVKHDVGRVPVVCHDDGARLVGIITRSDLLRAHRRHLRELKHQRAGWWGAARDQR